MHTTLFFTWFVTIFIYMMLLSTSKRDLTKGSDNLTVNLIYNGFSSVIVAAICYYCKVPLTISGGSFAIIMLATLLTFFATCSTGRPLRTIFALLGLIAIYIVTSTFWFNAKDMGNLISPVEINEPLFTDVQDINQRLVPSSVIASSQQKAVNGRLKDGSMIATMYKLDHSSRIIQIVDGKKYYATPLTWGSQWKWMINDYDVIGYVLSSATESGSEAKLITKNPDGTDISIKVTKDGYFSANLYRNLYSKVGSVNTHGTFFYLDDDFYPYYVSYKVKRAIGIDNYVPDGVYLTDPQTMDVTYYAQDNIPSFIDANTSESLLLDNIDMWGDYREGLVAALGSKIELSATSFNDKKEMFFIDAAHTQDGTAYFTGMENPSSTSKSLSAMMFVDSKTLQPSVYYPSKEAQNEQAVIDSVRSSLGNLADKWTPTQPIPYRIYGDVDVWLTPIVSSRGTSLKVEAYAYTKVFSTDKSVWDFKLSNAVSKLLTQSNESGDSTNQESREEITGTVRTIYFVNDMAYLTLDGLGKVIECNHQSIVECRGINTNQSLSMETMKKTDKELVILGFTTNPLLN
ncbi:hypothetical protein LMH73_010305 [Vibrio splendidus]|nr:hypothetical protein [Vibrio splendidus]MCC4882745.1 hypothetical protein [Vibrio splendidus]